MWQDKKGAQTDITLYTDGGSRGNPGPSACAYVICNLENNVVEKAGFYLGVATNNQAEYEGLRRGLRRAKELGARKILVQMDSELAVKQLNGHYRVKNRDLIPVHQTIKDLAAQFKQVNFAYISREHNQVADQEVNRILDQQGV